MDADAASHGEEGLAYVGTTVCASCHAEAFAAWSGSDHDRAMQEPSDQTVLGAFDGSTVSHGDETFVLVTRDGGFVAADLRFIHEYYTGMVAHLLADDAAAAGRPHDAVVLHEPASIACFEDHLSYVHRSPVHVAGGLVDGTRALSQAHRAFADA